MSRIKKEDLDSMFNQKFMDIYEWSNLKVDSDEGIPFPTFHQYIRAKRALELKRILIADWTGGGKTAAATLTQILLEEREQKPIKTLVTAPLSALHSAWTDEKINDYYDTLKKPRKKVMSITKPNDLKQVQDADILVINDDKFSITSDPRENRYFGYLSERKFDLIICDEAHREKNKESNRSRTLVELVNNVNPDSYLLLLTATPICRDPNDLGLLLHLLDPKLFPKANLFDYEKDIVATRRVLGKYMYRLTRKELSEIFPLPNIQKIEKQFSLDPDLIKEYIECWADEHDEKNHTIKSIWKLRKNLAKQKIREITKEDGLIDYCINSGQQVAIYSEMREGVMNNLEEILSKKYPDLGVVRIDGEIGTYNKKGVREVSKNRTYLAKKFQDGDAKIILFTSVMGEGVALNNNTEKNDSPISLIRMEKDMTYSKEIQIPGRVDRKGQKKDITVYDLVVSSPELSKEMRERAKDIQERYDVYIPKKFRATTIDEGFRDVNKVRQEVASAILDVREIDDIDKLLMQKEEKALEWSIYLNLMNLLPRESPQQQAIRMARSWNGLGAKEIQKLQNKKIWDIFVELYNHNWEYSASAHTARLIYKIAQGLESKTGELDQILDAGCGAAYMSRIFKQGMNCLDLSSQMLRLGKEEVDKLNDSEKLNINNNYIQRKLQDSGLENKSLNLLICSYVLQYQAQQPTGPEKNGPREIEDALIEFNRLLSVGGYLMIALPRNLEENCFNRFNAGMKDYGFEISEELSGYFKVSKCLEVNAQGNNELNPNAARFKGTYLTLARKIEDLNSYNSSADNFLLYNHKQRIFVGGKDHKIMKKGQSMPRKEICVDFSREGLGVDVLLNEYLKKL